MILMVCFHPGSKTPSFARWADNRASCLKHMGNLAHFLIQMSGREKI